MTRPQRIAGGISLIEAVVALAVIAFGMLAYVGLQSSMRFNSDVAKQRAEAVRIAQEEIEKWRAYAVIEPIPGPPPVPPVTAYDSLPASPPSTATQVLGDNGSFTLQRTVTDAAITSDPLLIGAAPRMKTLTVDVEWQDRNGETQNVRLSTTVAASPPELAGTLALPISSGGAHGRNAAIPQGAKNLGQGLSGYKPPGTAGASTVYVFNNATGLIVGVCNNVATGQAALSLADVQSCSSNRNGMPLSGYVRFATDMVDAATGDLRQPDKSDAENPPSNALNLNVTLTLTGSGPSSPTSVTCHADAPSSLLASTTQKGVAYFCAIFFNPGTTSPWWSGISELVPLAFADPGEVVWDLAVDTVGKPDARASRYRVCRYTPAANDAQVIPNQLHPRTYNKVGADEALTHQNFLVIRAGNDDGVTTSPQAFICPKDVAADPTTGDFVNSNTLLHQPPP